ncbi:transcription termination/antitermination NusG family protein [Mesorhizobium sp. RMAD-H1]|uniref:transcription termination/antitermination protein NusG n=1 Tax=Mesorhizobium sp. RMAD-H1 TaxID=2587065 RepID=UPI0016123895|nr:transcription termination/antitermination NusG family protein [Mesorhizobium sp. RMAD-H1]MBB2973961.1 transcriptional antiterminator NusG [Mesorhizobium sp. RMAD-H1]
MMAVNGRQVEAAEAIDLTRAYAASDRAIAECRRRRKLIEQAAQRADESAPWLVLRVATGREVVVEEALVAAGIETLVPMKLGKKLRRQGREIPAKKEPVFVGYIFARCVISNECAAALLGFEHVAGILGGYETPYLIAADKVSEFKEKADSGHFDYEVPQSVFRRGMKVRIKDGIFAGAKGEIVSGGEKGKGSAVVAINFLGGVTPALMPLAILQPL